MSNRTFEHDDGWRVFTNKLRFAQLCCSRSHIWKVSERDSGVFIIYLFIIFYLLLLHSVTFVIAGETLLVVKCVTKMNFKTLQTRLPLLKYCQREFQLCVLDCMPDRRLTSGVAASFCMPCCVARWVVEETNLLLPNLTCLLIRILLPGISVSLRFFTVQRCVLVAFWWRARAHTFKKIKCE